MSKSNNILTGYCFLAALTENQNDLFNHVYVPICKRALSLYSLKGASHGNASDIKSLINEEYGIDIPQVIIKKLINATFKTLSNRAKKKIDFKVFQNGETFEINKYSFSDLEIQYKKGKRNANALQNAFTEYLISENLDETKIPSFSEFLDKNKKHLSSFFKNSDSLNGKDLDLVFIHHVHFLEYIDASNHDLFEIAKGLYLGSIVASFFESGIDLEAKFQSNEIYFLDTPIILRALDLQKEEETEPIRELIKLITSTGGKIKILSITIEEISRVIENAIGNYNNVTPTSTINEACVRRSKNKTWLITYNGNLEKNILDSLKIEKENILTSFIDKHQKSADIKALQIERNRTGNALHDVIAYLYVRELRGASVSLFQKAKVWFLTNNTELLKFNKKNNPNNGISEIVLPDALTSLLWLKNPVKLIDKVKKVGLSELMAATLNEEIASKEIINEFESNIKNIDGISEDDYKTLLESVAHQSAKRIENFNEIAFNDNSKAKVAAHKIVEWEKSRKAKRIKTIKDAQSAQTSEEQKNKKLHEKLNKIESDLSAAKSVSDSSQTKIELLSLEVERQKKLLNRVFIWLLITILIGVIVYLGFHFYSALSYALKIFNWILGAGGLFGLINLIFNAIKFFKGK